MKLSHSTLIGLSTFIASAQPAFAEAVCKINGKVVPCPDVPWWFLLFPFIIGALALIGFIFWLLMLIDAITKQKENKLMWVMLIVFLNLLGAVIYYFMAKRKRAKS